MVKPGVSIIGLGRLGTALKKNLTGAGYKVAGFSKKDELVDVGEFVFITTPDGEIENVVNQLNEIELEGKTVVHCSGLVPVSVLSPLTEKGAAIGSFHPNQAVTEKTQDFDGTVFDVVGGEDVFEKLQFIASSLKAKAILITEEQKQFLHIAAVMVSNYQVTLMHLAQKIGTEAELDSDVVQETMFPLMKSVLNNLEELAPQQALTGPIARGDEQTIRQHVKLLKNNPKLLNIYNELGKITVDMMTSDEREEVDQRINALFNK